MLQSDHMLRRDLGALGDKGERVFARVDDLTPLGDKGKRGIGSTRKKV